MLLYFDKEDKNLNKVERAIAELREGRQSNLAALYEALFSNDRIDVCLAAAEIELYLQRLNTSQIIRLSDSFRTYSYWYSNIDWKNVNLDKLRHDVGYHNYLWALRLGTFHSNGYFRQRCIEQLIQEDKSNKSICFIVLRLNDWVQPVRDVAIKACERISAMGIEEVIELLPYLDKLDGGLRKSREAYDDFIDVVVNIIREHFEEIDLSKLSKYDEKIRKNLYKIMLEQRLITNEQVISLLKQEKSSHCQRVLLDMYFKHCDYTIEDLDELLVCKSKLVQRFALEKKYILVGNYWFGAQELLLSDASGVRELARYILGKHTDIKPIEYYRDRLESEYKRVSIIGIGECGNKMDVKMLQPYIYDNDTLIAKAALQSICRLLCEEASDILYACLHDPRPVIMRAACREIAKYNIMLGANRVYALIEQSDSDYLKEKMIYRLLRENSWDRLPYLLMLYWHEDKYVRKAIQAAVAKRSIYGKISKGEADRIRSIMYNEKYNIPQGVCEKIEFDLKYISS